MSEYYNTENPFRINYNSSVRLMEDLLSGKKRVQVEEEVNNTNFNSIELDPFKK